jgi:hypothetical protein
METRLSGIQVDREAARADRRAFEPPVVPVDHSDTRAYLARSVDRDLATPDHETATERAYARDWADSSPSASATGSTRCRPRRSVGALPQTLRDPVQSFAGVRFEHPAFTGLATLKCATTEKCALIVTESDLGSACH